MKCPRLGDGVRAAAHDVEKMDPACGVAHGGTARIRADSAQARATEGRRFDHLEGPSFRREDLHAPAAVLGDQQQVRDERDADRVTKLARRGAEPSKLAQRPASEREDADAVVTHVSDPHLARMNRQASWVVQLGGTAASRAEAEGEGGSLGAVVGGAQGAAVGAQGAEAHDAVMPSVREIQTPTWAQGHARGQKGALRIGQTARCLRPRRRRR